MIAFVAFLHHLAAFTLVAALAVEFVLLRGELTAATMRRIVRADMIVGLSAGAVLLVGLARVFHFEKGAGYYFHSWPFIGKLSMFILVALLSIYPTVTFLSWGKALRQGQVPGVDAARLRAVRRLVHAELAGIVLILLFAAMMARGVGFFG
jgi:putative membrane protein